MDRRDRQDALFCGAILAFSILALVIGLAFSKPNVPARPVITNRATYAQVVANFRGKPYSTGSFVSGYTCAGYTAGKNGHGWVVIRCVK